MTSRAETARGGLWTMEAKKEGTKDFSFQPLTDVAGIGPAQDHQRTPMSSEVRSVAQELARRSAQGKMVAGEGLAHGPIALSNKGSWGLRKSPPMEMFVSLACQVIRFRNFS